MSLDVLLPVCPVRTSSPHFITSCIAERNPAFVAGGSCSDLSPAISVSISLSIFPVSASLGLPENSYLTSRWLRFTPGVEKNFTRHCKKNAGVLSQASRGICPISRMNTQLIHETASQTIAGPISFPEVVARLLQAGVEYYHVDYIARQKSFYAANGSAVVVTPLPYEGLPEVPSTFDTPAVRAAILDSQRHGQHYRDFTRRAMEAGVQGYFAFLHGKRVTYFGRRGEQHIEWFPGAQPAARE